MTGDPRAERDRPASPAADFPPWIPRAYTATYRGPHGDAPDSERQFADTAVINRAAVRAVTPAMLRAHFRLARRRAPGETRVAVYPADDPAGFGPAMQVVTEHGAMLMNSVAVLLHRLGVAYVGIMNPVFAVRRTAHGELVGVGPDVGDGAADGVDEMWIHIQLSPSVHGKALAEAERLLPNVLADVRQVAADSTAMAAALDGLAEQVETNADEHFSVPDRRDVAALLRWLADGHFVLLGYQRGEVRDGQIAVDEAARLGVLRLRKALRPRLTGDGKLLVLAQATVPSYVRFGAYPYIVVIRENAGDGIIEHRFVGLFTVAAMNANVLEIPLIAGRVQQALVLAERDPSHPGQLLLDIIQTVPRSELFALDAERLLTMAMAVVDLG